MKFKGIVLVLTLLLGAVPLLSSCSAEEGQDAASFAEFTAEDLDGNEVNQDIFSEYDLTMINIWATFCGPCLQEMPELGGLAGEYADKGVRIVGIVVDVLDQNGSLVESQVELAREIVKSTGADYLHLLPSEDLIRVKLKNVSAVPETVFVDSEGNQVGESYLGARDKASWAGIIDGLLKEVS